MQSEDIDNEVLRFIERYIDSVPHLEALLLLSEHPAHTWTEEAVATRIYLDKDRSRVVLNDLVRHGLIVDAGQRLAYRYDPTSAYGPIVAKVADAYRRHLVLIATLIHSKGSAAVRDFARAFEIKKRD